MADARANEDAQTLSRYKDFLQRYTRQARGGFLYSEQLRRHARLGQHWLQVDIDDLRAHDEALANDLLRAPASHLRLVSPPPDPSFLQKEWHTSLSLPSSHTHTV